MESVLSVLLPRVADCTKETCSVDQSLYGYLPNKIGNVLFAFLFAISCLVHLWQGIKSKSWTFLVALAVGTLLEGIGYVGRLMLRKDPFKKGAIGIQLVTLTVAPAFVAAGVYITLKHLIIIYGAKFSRIAPKLYTWIFVACDILSIILQMGGAVIASRADSGNTGTNIMMIGLASQVATLIVFGGMALDVFLRIRKHEGEFNEATNDLRDSRRFKGLLVAIILAYSTIFIRCIYRIAEMAGGWKNPIMQDEASFMILDGVMMLIAVFALNIFHPGFLFRRSFVMMKESATAEDLENTMHPL